MSEEMLTRAEIELRLERGLTGKMIQFYTIRSVFVIGKLQRLAVNYEGGEVLVVFMLGGANKLDRYECDIQYFNENTTILYGDTYTGTRTNIRRILKGDR